MRAAPAAGWLRGLRALLGAALLVVVAACINLGGCVDFDGQSVVLRHDTTLDSIDALLVYRGLRAEGPVEDAVAQMRKVHAQRVVALGSPLLFLDVDGMLSGAEDAREPPDWQTRLRAALAGLRVQHLGLWQDSAGRLCGAQRVTLEGVTDVLNQVNAALRDGLLKDADWMHDLIDDLGLARPEDVATAQRVLTAAPDFAFIALQRGAVTLSLPLAPEQHARAREALLASLGKLEERAAAGSRDALATRRFLVEHPVGLSTDGGGLHVVIGDASRDDLLLQWPADGPLDTGLLEALRAERWEIGGPETEDAVRASFEAPAPR